jgi:hypothetical protein
VFEGDCVFFAEDLEDRDAGLPGAVVVVGTVPANNVDEPVQSSIEILRKKESESLAITLPPGTSGKALGIRREVVQTGDGPDGLRDVRKFGVIDLLNEASRLLRIFEEHEVGTKYPGAIVLRVRLNNLFEELFGLHTLSLPEKLFRLRKLFSVFAGQRLLQPSLDLVFRHRTDEFTSDDPVDKELDVRDTVHLVALRDFRMLLRVYFCQSPSLAILSRESFENRAEDPARPAPLRPEIDKHGNFVAPLNDLLLEI